MKRSLFSILLFVSALKLPCQEISIREEKISLPTYPFSDPDPVARPGKIYPYFRFNGYSINVVEQQHRMVVMENKWIKVWIAPDMGGKVYGALDKKTGKYFIYFNKVVKFREIAMRGPWTSGGIEFNFGSIGHAPTTATPVDYCYRYNHDGSVSCFLGALELTSRTEWRVEVRLLPDKVWFEIRSCWNNPTCQKTSLYHWQTAAADATSDLHYFFPGNAYIDHSGNAFEWPVMADGRDISYYKNNDYGTYHSYHVLGEYADWFAGYYNNSKYGFGHWSRYPLKPGKKIWIWGLSRQGEIWKSLLTDSAKGNEQYTEIQTGLLFNQEGDESTLSPFKHMFLMPGAVETFYERWFPISNTGGVASISPEGILNLEKIEKRFRLVFQSLGYTKDILQVCDTSGHILYDYQIDMEPEQIFEKEIETTSENIIVRLKDGELYYQSGGRKSTLLGRPLKILPGFNWESVYGLYSRGIEKSRQRLYTEAREYFNKCISKDTFYLPAYTGLAEIDFREMKYEDAEKNVLRVLSFDTYDPDANFLYGNILSLKKEYNKARDAYGLTLRSPGYKPASFTQLAVLALRERRLDEAWEYIMNAEMYNNHDNSINRTAAVIARLRNDNTSYNMFIDRLSSIDPISHFASFENYYAKKDSLSLRNFIAGINTELKYETFIELALWYYNAGLYKEATEVITLSPAHPLSDFLSAYLAFLQKDNVKSEFYLKRALSADDKLVFPFREEFAEILGWADAMKPEWKIKYYNALLYWSKGQITKAAKFFDECADLPDSYSFYLSRGSFIKQTGGCEEADYLEAMKYGSAKWQPYHLLHGYYMSAMNFEKALTVSSDAMKLFPGSYIIRTDHIQSLLNAGRYRECIGLLKNTVIVPYEGAGYGRTIWRQAHLLESARLINDGKIREAMERIKMARQWPENLGVGKPYVVDESFEDLLEAYCLSKSGKTEKAKVITDRIISSLKPDGSGGTEVLAGVIALTLQKKEKEASELLAIWSGKNNDPVLKAWANAIFSKTLPVPVSDKSGSKQPFSIVDLPKNNPEILLIEEIQRLYVIR